MPFYYDWRKNVTDNAILLMNYINSNITSDEKVDLVGHSMGGLIGRSYFESNQGGQLSKFLTVGTPHQGSALAYAPWSGGEVWRSNLIETIGINLYLKHCGGIFSNNRQTIRSQVPSVQNLLPTVDYIKNMQTKIIKPITSMNAKNNYLPTDFASNFWGVKVGAISGSGFPTLNIIGVAYPSRKDIKDGNWLDGIPIDKKYSNLGDGTVLESSSQIPGAINTTINETHSGLVGTTNGINHILDFLGSPGVDDPPFIEPKSALVIVGYPGNFSITNENGEITNSEDGMIALINPESGRYQLQINPLLTNTTFAIGQFMANNQILYKEYRFIGLATGPKIIEFNSKHPTENILHEIKEYRNPNFPKQWLMFWKYWRNYWKR
jgi:hypothetical protein